MREQLILHPISDGFRPKLFSHMRLQQELHLAQVDVEAFRFFSDVASAIGFMSKVRFFLFTTADLYRYELKDLNVSLDGSASHREPARPAAC